MNENNTYEAQPLDYLSKIIKEVTESPQDPTPSQAAVNERSDTQSTAAQSGSADFISSILSNPELLSKLPTLISSIKPIMDIFTKAQPNPTQSAQITSQETSIPASVQAISATKTMGDSNKRAALLSAMKPYLNHERQDTIDYIIKLSRLGDVLKSL